MKKIFKILTYYNLANAIIAFLYEMIKGFINVPVIRFIILIFHSLIAAFSYVIFPAIIVSAFLIIYYLVRAFRNKEKHNAYILIFINMINFLSLSYLALLALVELGV